MHSMNIKESATYPYPIWGVNQGFNGPEPDGSYKLRKDNNRNELVLTYDVITQNEGINKLISEGKAMYKCIVECSSTYQPMIKKFDNPHMELRIPADQVHKGIDVTILIVATQDIDDCTYLDVNEIYGDSISYPKGYPIAYIHNFRRSIDQKDNSSDLGKIFRTKACDVPAVKYSIEGPAVLIQYPKEFEQNFCKIADSCPSVIESSFVLPAMVYAISELYKYYQRDDLDWVFYLKCIVANYFETQSLEVPDEYKFEDLDEIYNIAQSVLYDVQENLLKDVCLLLEPHNEEE